MTPLLRYYRIYSTHYRGIPVRAVLVPVITAVISYKFPRYRGFPADYFGITAVISPLWLSKLQFANWGQSAFDVDARDQ